MNKINHQLLVKIYDKSTIEKKEKNRVKAKEYYWRNRELILEKQRLRREALNA
jgi:hypothetical protein